MGLFDLLKPGKARVEDTRSALEQADAKNPDEGAVAKLVERILTIGLDGVGPLSSAEEFAAKSLRREGDAESAAKRVSRHSVVGAGIGGFATGLGGFATMPVALPVNLLEFYVQAARMVGAIATLRGYDVTEPRVRTAVLLTLVGSNSDDVLKKAGLTTVTGRATSFALRSLPPAVLMAVNKAIGFRLIRGLVGKTFARLGRFVPVAGGVIGAGLDGWMMRNIGKHALREFPPLAKGLDAPSQ